VPESVHPLAMAFCGRKSLSASPVFARGYQRDEFAFTISQLLLIKRRLRDEIKKTKIAGNELHGTYCLETGYSIFQTRLVTPNPVGVFPSWEKKGVAL
jgi:hypothetical protein